MRPPAPTTAASTGIESANNRVDLLARLTDTSNMYHAFIRPAGSPMVLLASLPAPSASWTSPDAAPCSSSPLLRSQPATITANLLSAWNQSAPADLSIISHQAFLQELQPLKTWRDDLTAQTAQFRAEMAAEMRELKTGPQLGRLPVDAASGRNGLKG